MFQSSDDIQIDEDFLNDVFDNPSTNKRNSDPLEDQPVKKVCTQSPDHNTKNILSIIKSQSQTKSLSNPFPKPSFPCNKPLINKNSSTMVNRENRRVVQRKFPGPAGILPEQKLSNVKTLEAFDASTDNKNESDEIVCSQLSDDIFKKNTWYQMLRDWSGVYNRLSLPNKYTISWIKTKAIAKKLIGQKTPFLAAVVQAVDCSSKDPMILLKDQTGDIQATLLHEVWEEYCDYLNQGSVIVLKQVGVLSTLKKHYLAVTLNNIVAIYSEDETGKVKTINIQDLTVEEFIETVESTKKIFEAQKIIQKLQPPGNNPYFRKPSNVVQKSPDTQNKSISRNEISNNTNRTPNKFNFKTINKENKQTNVSTSLSSSSDVTSNSSKSEENLEENIILTQVLDGLDANSLFEEF